MEIVCIDKKAFDEICSHFNEFEDRVNRLCRPNQDLGLKNWMDNQDVCQILRISKRTLQVYREKGLIPFARIKPMSSFFIDKTDPHIAEILERLRRVNKILQKTETLVQPTLNNERFLTDEELSKILRVSRRTLQEYRSAGAIPYYLVQGKALYKESEIEKILNDSHKRCVEEQRWV